MKAVKGHRYLYRRGDKLIYRRSVPMFAQAAFDNRAEVQVSLRTSEVAEARHLLPRENAKFEKTIADLIPTIVKPDSRGRFPRAR